MYIYILYTHTNDRETEQKEYKFITSQKGVIQLGILA